MIKNAISEMQEVKTCNVSQYDVIAPGNNTAGCQEQFQFQRTSISVF